jgi:D-lyxose ketol-isomerase
MKRSELNAIMKDAVDFIEKMNFKLPEFAYWTLDDWKTKNSEYDEIIDNMLGWDITDFGSGDYSKVGLLMFTIRNGNFSNEKYQKPYCEKLLIVEEEQITPYHFHFEKMEDIINRGGGNLVVKVYNKTDDETLADTPVMISKDGRNYMTEAGTEIILKPGESITLLPGQYHSFWGQKGTGKVLVGEVSKVNNDYIDNRFLEKTGRFPDIEEDAVPLYLLYTDYPKQVSGDKEGA